MVVVSTMAKKWLKELTPLVAVSVPASKVWPWVNVGSPKTAIAETGCTSKACSPVTVYRFQEPKKLTA